MKYYSLAFRIDFFDDWIGYDPFKNDNPHDAERGLLKMAQECGKRREIYASLGLKLFSGAWSSIVLNEINAERLHQAVEALKAERIGFLGSGMLREEPSLGEDTPEWSELYESHISYTGKDFDDRGIAYPICRACNYSPTQNFCRPHFVSEKFKTVVEKAGLTGLDFLWVKDVGKYKASQWYAAIASQPLGFGLDHPWYDRENAFNRRGRLPENAFGGMHSFSGNVFRKGWTTSSEILDSLLSQFPLDHSLGLRFSSPPRYLRAYLPQTDFAYSWRNMDSFARYDSTVLIRHRSLCCNAKAREVLINERIMKEKEFEGFIILDDVPESIVDLHQIYPVPPPFYTTKAFANLHVAEEKNLQQFLAIEKPKRRPDLRRALKLLRDVKKQRPDDFSAKVSATKIATVLKDFPFVLPDAWVEVIQTSNGGKLGIGDDLECEIEPLAGLRQMNKEEIEKRREDSDDFVGGYVYFGRNGFGDLYAFQKTEKMAVTDCPVALISHEDFDIIRSWASIPDFLEEVLADG